MKKKQRKQNKKKKTKHDSTVTQKPTQKPISSTTLSSSPILTELLGAQMESLLCLSTQTEGDGATVCKEIDDLALSGPGNFLNNDDYHAWCIDDKGLICDYSSAQLVMKSYHGTSDMIRRPFTAHEIPKMLAHCDKIYDAYLEGIAAEFGGDVEAAEKALLSMIDTPLFPLGNCYIRAKLLHKSNPKKYSLVIGSLGFRQADGTIYWEWG